MNDQTIQTSNVLKFRALVDSDPVLRDEVRQHVGNNTWDANAIVELGRGRALDFSAEDLCDAMDEEDELSDFELELVAAASVMDCGVPDV